MTEMLKPKKNLFPTKDGKIVDLSKLIERKRRKDDNFTFETSVNLLSNENELENAHKYFDSICDNAKHKNYVLTYLSYCLTGYNSNKLLIELSGETNTGKSALIHVLGAVLGEFMKIIDVSVIRGAKTRMEQRYLSGCRLGVFNYLTDDAGINVRNMKVIHRSIGMKLINMTDRHENVAEALLCKKYVPIVLSRVFKPDHAYIEDLMANHKNEIFTLLARYCRNWFDDEGRIKQMI